ncbi:permease-like cell division protein FtsX [Nocardia otitidiscaviarum]|uniref:Cell division protein FtsX n=1 Tax=Nocardia otitidiscaviarum TaxID=1823 RepID=A0A516NH03_9NOCA|nr:permease-like cell division protein FtsX [Nocardia otitidiscaviarum]MBF6177769.1 ABC transporter permease [Nocardia otitidiscaviarum]MCP9623500.1 permease-like cell division protein FtsX [Nocardia otitidiscaviarum]QDP78181.1 ABC transporter permease [Nocardia otitidiscaviarum]
MRVGFLLGEVFTGLRRNITMTIAMILTTAVSLTMLGGGLLAVRMADKIENFYMDRVEIRLYLDDTVSTTDPDCLAEPCKSLQADLKANDKVASVQFVNSEEAVKEVKETTFKDQPGLADEVTKEGLPASFRVKLTDAENYQAIYDEFATRPGVMTVLNDKDIVDRLVSFFVGLRNAAFGLALLQAFAALLLIANMVQVAALARKTEVGIMRLVGATRWYTQLPFLLEAVLAALVGSALAVAGLFIAKPLVINRALGDLFDNRVLPGISGDDIAAVSFVILPVGVGFAALTAYAALRYYVRE